MLDFRVGNNLWGHAMHAVTMRQVTPRKWKERLSDRFQKAYRVSVMIHFTRCPKIGEEFLWSAKAGHVVHAKVYDVDPCMDPKDMYTVFLRVKT